MIKKGEFWGITTIDIQFVLENGIELKKNNHAKQVHLDIGGMATNAAITFKFLGGSSTLHSHIGKSNFESIIENKIKSYNINHINLESENNETNTTISAIITPNNGDRTIFTKYENNNLRIESNRIHNCDIILIDNSMNAYLKFIKKNIPKEIPVVYDVDELSFFEDRKFSENEIVIASENVFNQISNIKEFISSKSIKKLAFTRGEKSILSFDNGIINEIEVDKVNVIDTLGAGDIFHGAFCFYYSTEGFVKSLKLASKIASNSCKYLGTREWRLH